MSSDEECGGEGFGEQAPVVIDNGSSHIKAGFAGDDSPHAVFPSIVGRRGAKVYVGDEALSKRDTLKLAYPIERGSVATDSMEQHGYTGWDDMEKLWHHTYNELRVVPEEHAVMLSEPPMNPKAHREKTTQIMFENLSTPKMFLSMDAVLALYASARTTGAVLSSGYGVTHLVPVHEGYAIEPSIMRHDLGGRDLTEYLAKLLMSRGYNFKTAADLEIVRGMKERFAYAADDFNEQCLRAKGSADILEDYELPDGKVVQFGAERFRCTEAMFKPTNLGMEAESVVKMLHKSIQKTHGVVGHDIREELYASIVLTGGNTMFTGFPERVRIDMEALAPRSTIKVVAPYERKYSTWIGAAILAALGTMQDMWITMEEYNETGPSIVHKKC